MAPVARRIADGQEDGLVLRIRSGKGFVAPGVPVHGVCRVLEKIWTCCRA